MVRLNIHFHESTFSLNVVYKTLQLLFSEKSNLLSVHNSQTVEIKHIYTDHNQRQMCNLTQFSG